MPGQLVLLCGRSFSGKSVLARALTDELPGGTLISLDAINDERDLHGGQGIPVEEWVRTHELARERAAAALTRDDTVIVDDTSSPRFLRDAWRSLAADNDARFVLVYIDAAEETIRDRLAANRASSRRPDVTDAVMSEHLSGFEPPGEDEKPLSVVARDVTLPQMVAAVSNAISRQQDTSEDEPRTSPSPVTPQADAILPTLSTEWGAFAVRLESRMAKIEELDKGVFLLFNHHPGDDIGLARSRSVTHDWALYGANVPSFDWQQQFFNLDEDDDVLALPRGRYDRATIAHLSAALLSSVFATPEEVYPMYLPDVAPYTLPDEIAAQLWISLAGSTLRRPAMARGRPPEPRLIRTPHDAELVAAEWVAWFGYTNVGVTPVGADAGIDVFSDQVYAQVKMEGVKTGRPVVQSAYGVAVADGRSAMVFSLGGFLPTAVDWADRAGVPLFEFDFQGVPRAVNAAARSLFPPP